MKIFKISLAGMFLAVLSLASTLFAQDARPILEKMDSVMFNPLDQTSQVKMILTDRSGNQREREAQIWQKGTDKRMFRFTKPASEAGIAFLSLPNDLMYLYMPSFGRERRIASHVKNQSFAGTDFSYEDMESKEFAKSYTGKVIEENANSIVVELKPLPSIRSDYSKMVITVNKKYNYPEMSQSFDRGGRLAKTTNYKWEKSGKYWYPKEIHLRDEKRGSSTRMIFTNVKFDTGLGDEFFTVRNLVSL